MSRAAKALLIVAALEFVISLVLTIWRLVQLLSELDINDPDSISDVIGAAVLLVNLGTRWSTALACHAATALTRHAPASAAPVHVNQSSLASTASLA